MQTEFMERTGDVDNLLLSMNGLKYTPGIGHIIVQLNLDKAIDCKDAECRSIISIISLLLEHKKYHALIVRCQLVK